MEPLRWNEAKPKDHRTKHENQACLVADKGLDVANYSRASGGGRKMFLTSPLQELGQQLLSNQQPSLAKFLAPVTPPLAQSTALIDQVITRFDPSEPIRSIRSGALWTAV